MKSELRVCIRSLLALIHTAQRSTQSENALAHRFLCARYVGPGHVVANPMEEEKKDGAWTQWGLAD